MSRAIARAAGHGRRLDDAPLGWGWRLASALPVVALVAGLWGIHAWYSLEQLQAATEVDIALLTDDLPLRLTPTPDLKSSCAPTMTLKLLPRLKRR